MKKSNDLIEQAKKKSLDQIKQLKRDHTLQMKKIAKENDAKFILSTHKVTDAIKKMEHTTKVEVKNGILSFLFLLQFVLKVRKQIQTFKLFLTGTTTGDGSTKKGKEAH